MDAAPRLMTDRLCLRPVTPDDLSAFARFMASDRARFVGGPSKGYDAWRRFAVHLGHWRIRGYGMWIVERREDGAAVGQVGPWNPDGWVAPEVGWWLLDAAFEGHGYAREAAIAARAHAFDTLGWPAVYSVIAPDNARSIALARRLGAVEDREATTPDGQPVIVFRHPSPGERPNPTATSGELP